MTGKREFLLSGILAAAAALLYAEGAPGSAYDELVRYDWNKSRKPLATIEEEIRHSAATAAREAVEEKLLGALADPNATYECKQFVCRMLRRIGSEASVAALAKLLSDPKLSHMARFALEGHPSSEASDALRRAMRSSTGKLKIGVIASLGQRRDERAVASLARLAAGRDEETARAAISALARIGSPEAAEALSRARVPLKLNNLQSDACLMCADRMLADGERYRATAIYRRMFAEGNPKMIRIAALRGIVLSEKERAAGILVKLMSDPDIDLRRAASKFVVEMPGEAATRALAAELRSLPPEAQVVLIDALTARGDTAAAPEVTRLIEGGDEAVRIAAIRALAVLGDASSVPMLARAASAGGEVGKAAVDSLGRIKGEDVGRAMADLLDSPDASIRAGIISVLTARADKTMAPAMVRAARDKDQNIRNAAIKGLAAVGDLEELPEIVALLLEYKVPTERSGLEKALASAAMRVSDTEARTSAITDGLRRADSDAKVRMLGVLGRLGGTGALTAVRRQLKTELGPHRSQSLRARSASDARPEGLRASRSKQDAEVVTAAVRALHSWPDAAPAADLLNVIKTTRDSTHRALAFRGYIRMANMPGVRSAAETARMYEEALSAASGAAEKKSVLGGLANARSAGALALVGRLTADPAVRAEAEMALVQIAGNCRDSAPNEARAALNKVIASTGNGGLRGKAQGIIREMDKYRGYITSWLGSGPYTKGATFNTAYAGIEPRRSKALRSRIAKQSERGATASDAVLKKWKVLTKGVSPQRIDLLQAIGGGSNRAAYMKTHVWSPTSQDVRLEMGSDDGIKVWINDKLVHSNPAVRGLRPGEDKAKASLKRGWNKMLVKIFQGGGDWAFCIRITRPDGAALEGLKVNVEE